VFSPKHYRPPASPTILLPMLSTTHYRCNGISHSMVRYCVTVGLMRASRVGARRLFDDSLVLLAF